MIIYIAYIVVGMFLLLIRFNSFLCCLVCGHVRFVDYAGDKAVVIKRALAFFSTVASVLRCAVIVANKDVLVVVVSSARSCSLLSRCFCFSWRGVLLWKCFLSRLKFCTFMLYGGGG